MSRRPHSYFPHVRVAITLLGVEIRRGRLERRWTVKELAERAGISPNTLLRVEVGNPDVGIGIMLECAHLVGVPLFVPEDDMRSRELELKAELEHSRNRLALLPRRARRPMNLDVDF